MTAKWLRHIIVRAAPTCKLWVYRDFNVDTLFFRFWPRWHITYLEIVEVG